MTNCNTINCLYCRKLVEHIQYVSHTEFHALYEPADNQVHLIFVEGDKSSQRVAKNIVVRTCLSHLRKKEYQHF